MKDWIRKKLLEQKRKRLNRQFCKVNIIGEEKDECGKVHHLIIMDENGIIVNYPMALVQANKLDISEGLISLTKDMYDVWFISKLNEEISLMRACVRKYFGKIVSKSSFIINDNELSEIHIPNLLQSHKMNYGSVSYTLGSLFKSWIDSEDLMIKEGVYLIRICGNSYTGLNRYLAWDYQKKILISESFDEMKINWEKYFAKFMKLENADCSSAQDKCTIMNLEKLFLMLNLEY